MILLPSIAALPIIGCDVGHPRRYYARRAAGNPGILGEGLLMCAMALAVAIGSRRLVVGSHELVWIALSMEWSCTAKILTFIRTLYNSLVATINRVGIIHTCRC